MSEANDTPPTMAVNAFQEAALTTLRELTQIDAFPAPTSSASESMPSGELLLATVRLLRPVPGAMTLVLTTNAASQLAARYLPVGTLLTAEIIDDVAGEFANVIAGQAKTILKGTLYHFTLSTPVVIRATNLPQFHLIAETTLAIALATELGRVTVFVLLAPCPNA